jgi:hypothetical protein
LTIYLELESSDLVLIHDMNRSEIERLELVLDTRRDQRGDHDGRDHANAVLIQDLKSKLDRHRDFGSILDRLRSGVTEEIRARGEIHR